MTADIALDPFQGQVARVALAAAESWSFALAGGNALVAHGLLVRPTEVFERDPGLRPEDPALAMHQLDLLEDEKFEIYGLSADAVARLRAALEGWPREPSSDEEARLVHATVHRTTG